MKLAICIPAYGQTHAKFTQSLANMIVHTMAAKLQDQDGNEIPVQIETFMVSSSMLTESRHRLVAEALHWDADYMLWLDADHVFPHDTFCRLWAHGLPIVGANYPRRFSPTAPTAAYHSEEKNSLLYTTFEKASAGEVEECAHMGFGVCLMNMAVFDALQEKADRDWDGNFLPLFQFTPTPDKVGMIGEDVFFFRKLKEAGVVPFIDHKLSWEVGHLHEVILTNAHACVQKDKWDEYWKNRAAKFEQKANEIEQQAESEQV